jgi:hypothetical protein
MPHIMKLLPGMMCRPRVKGRFVKQKEWDEMELLSAAARAATDKDCPDGEATSAYDAPDADCGDDEMLDEPKEATMPLRWAD